MALYKCLYWNIACCGCAGQYGAIQMFILEHRLLWVCRPIWRYTNVYTGTSLVVGVQANMALYKCLYWNIACCGCAGQYGAIQMFILEHRLLWVCRPIWRYTNVYTGTSLVVGVQANMVLYKCLYWIHVYTGTSPVVGVQANMVLYKCLYWNIACCGCAGQYGAIQMFILEHRLLWVCRPIWRYTNVYTGTSPVVGVQANMALYKCLYWNITCCGCAGQYGAIQMFILEHRLLWVCRPIWRYTNVYTGTSPVVGVQAQYGAIQMFILEHHLLWVCRPIWRYTNVYTGTSLVVGVQANMALYKCLYWNIACCWCAGQYGAIQMFILEHRLLWVCRPIWRYTNVYTGTSLVVGVQANMALYKCLYWNIACCGCAGQYGAIQMFILEHHLLWVCRPIWRYTNVYTGTSLVVGVQANMALYKCLYWNIACCGCAGQYGAIQMFILEHHLLWVCRPIWRYTNVYTGTSPVVGVQANMALYKCLYWNIACCGCAGQYGAIQMFILEHHLLWVCRPIWCYTNVYTGTSLVVGVQANMALYKCLYWNYSAIFT